MQKLRDDEFECIHYYCGPGVPSEYAYHHQPSGITVRSAIPPGMAVTDFHQQLFRAFLDKLRAAGILLDESPGAP